MAVSPVEFSISTSFGPSSLSHLYVPSKISCFGLKVRGIVNKKLGFSSIRVSNFTEKECSSSSDGFRNIELEVGSKDLGDDCGVVDVIAIGSRKDAILEFCFDSPFQLSSLRFWSVLAEDASNMQLVQRFRRKDLSKRVVDVAFFQQSCSKIIILVAGAGYGLDHTKVIDVLKTIRSAKGFAVAVVMKPFSFEGQRRLDEVKDLVGKLQDHIDLFVDIDTDTLLKKELVTFDEALKIANSAALLALNTSTVLVSETHRRKLNAMHNNVKELNVSEVVKILRRYREAKIGFGAAYDMSSSISLAIYDCPFIGAGIKDLDGVVVCVLASSNAITDNDVQVFMDVFRQTTEYTGEIIISVVHEPKVEPNLIVTTVVVIGCLQQEVSPKSSIFSRLAQHLSFVSNLFKIHQLQPNDALKNGSPKDPGEKKIGVEEYCPSTPLYDHSAEISSNYPDTSISSNHNNGSDNGDFASLDGRASSPNHDEVAEGNSVIQREALSSSNLGPGHQIAEEWAKERTADTGANPMSDNLSIFSLPVGVRPSEDRTQRKSEADLRAQFQGSSSMPSFDAFTGAGFEAVREFYSNASTIIKGGTDEPKKQGVLSARAASMLEAERDAPKKWNPIVELQYRGGVYKGHCQGGLPEGKGRLILGDGSIYDGMWHYGKKSGLGTFYFGNGDVFQGTWRDDLMHGKGWFYFHTGDRWFTNFWKGKANGEGRFYSKSGEIYFGRFEDGWRHGRFLCINVDGVRCIEIWNEGILVSREQLDTDALSGG